MFSRRSAHVCPARLAACLHAKSSLDATIMVCFLLTVSLLALNMLIAMMATTYERMQGELEGHFMFLTSLLHVTWSSASPVPAPLLILSVPFHAVRLVRMLFECCCQPLQRTNDAAAAPSALGTHTYSQTDGERDRAAAALLGTPDGQSSAQWGSASRVTEMARATLRIQHGLTRKFSRAVTVMDEEMVLKETDIPSAETLRAALQPVESIEPVSRSPPSAAAAADWLEARGARALQDSLAQMLEQHAAILEAKVVSALEAKAAGAPAAGAPAAVAPAALGPSRKLPNPRFLGNPTLSARRSKQPSNDGFATGFEA